MACKYYDKKTGLVNELLTDLYGYMDTVQNKNRFSVCLINNF